MTLHSIEELKRQMDAAFSRLRAADIAHTEAKRAYHGALLDRALAEFRAAGGVVGETRVIALDSLGRPVTQGEHVVTGAEMDYTTPKLMVAKVKKDGTPGGKPVASWRYSRVQIVEPIK